MFNPYRILYGVIIGVALFFGGYAKGFIDGKSSELKYIVKGVEIHAKREKEVIRLDVSDLKRRYCEWVRDDRKACMQADIPISE